MAILRSKDYRIRSGTHAVVDVTDTYRITNFPRQADQGGHPWQAPDSFKSTVPLPPQIVQTLDMNLHVDGFYTWQWSFGYLTNDMYGYWLTTFLNSTDWSADVTVKTFDETDTEVYLTAILQKPQITQAAELQQGGWQNIVFRFTKGVIIT